MTDALLHSLQDRRSELLNEIATDDADLATIAARRSVRIARLEEVDSFLALATEAPKVVEIAAQPMPGAATTRARKGALEAAIMDRLRTVQGIHTADNIASALDAFSAGAVRAKLRELVTYARLDLDDGRYTIHAPTAEPSGNTLSTAGAGDPLDLPKFLDRRPAPEIQQKA